MSTPRRLIVGPFNRVEGDLEVTLEISDGQVAAARVTSPMYRGFEAILQGRPPMDALTIAPRICGICSVSQSVAAARALAHLSDLQPAHNGRIVTDLALACENAADHLTHFLLFFMPDFARPDYAHRPWHPWAVQRFAAQTGDAGQHMLPARARFMHLLGILAGKWPHSLAFQPGGSTKSVDNGERIRLLSIVAEFRAALEQHIFAAPLDSITAINSKADLQAWADAAPANQGDFRLFLHIARDLNLDQCGRGPAAFLSHGSFGLWQAGTVMDGQSAPLDMSNVVEDLRYSWLAGDPSHPQNGITQPAADKTDGYSWCKAPRLNQRPMEVGALARHRADNHPLAQDLIGQGGGTVQDRVVMRMIELARLVLAMPDWIKSIRPREPFCSHAPLPDQARGFGLTEAARGALGHWITVDGGIIHNYQIIAPTTWNFSPRDDRGIPGPLEQALVGAIVRPQDHTPLMVQHVVRSFDPCMACTVH